MTRHASPGWFTRFRARFPMAQGTEAPPVLDDQRDPDWPQSYDAAVLRILNAEVKRVGTIRSHHWVMSPAWYQTIKGLKDAYGEYFWSPPMHEGYEYLLGLPILVRTGLGPPRVVPHIIDTGAFRAIK